MKSCFLCGSDRWEDVGVSSEHGNMFRCVDCGLVRLEKSAAAKNQSDYLGRDEEKIFPVDRHESFDVWSGFRLDQLLRVKPDIRSLAEVGSGTGHFLKAAMARGINVTGFDLADHRRCGKEAAFECASDPFSLLGGSQWDAVVAFHVLEHCGDPVGAIRSMLASLGATGIAFVEIPGILEETPPVPCMIDPRHQWYFSEQTLRNLVGKAGGHVQAVERVGPTQGELETQARAGERMTRLWGFLKAILPAGCVNLVRTLAAPHRERGLRLLSNLEPVRGDADAPLNLCVFFRRA